MVTEPAKAEVKYAYDTNALSRASLYLKYIIIINHMRMS